MLGNMGASDKTKERRFIASISFFLFGRKIIYYIRSVEGHEYPDP